MDAITIHGIEVWAHHGVLPAERDRGQPFVIDVRLEADLSRAADSDDLDDTVDYAAVAHDVTVAARSGPHDLIETVAGRVADAVLEHPRAVAVEVTVHKPYAPLPAACAGVSVTLYRSRDER